MDEDGLAALDRRHQSVRGARQVGELLGGLDLLQRGTEEPLRRLDIVDAARREEPADRDRHGRLSRSGAIGPQGGGETFGDPLRRGRDAFPARRGPDVPHTWWYISTPQTSHSSITLPAIIACRRCIGIAVSHAPHESAVSGTTTRTRFLLRIRS